MNNIKVIFKFIDQTIYKNIKYNNRQQDRQSSNCYVIFENFRRQEKFNFKHDANIFRSRLLLKAMNDVTFVNP